MVQRQSGVFKEEPGTAVSDDHHHPHHTPQQGPPPHHLQQSRPSSIVHQQHHPQQAPPTQSQHPNPYPPHGGLPPYPQGPPTSAGQLSQDAPYYQSHPSPYTTSTSGNYSSAETPEIMAAAQMGTRPYPPISYHTPQPNSPASAASPSGHDQHRMYGAPQSQLQPGAPMYYTGPPQQYPPMPSQGGPSYTPHPQQHHPPMTSQQGLLMAHGPGQHQMQQHQGQHAPQQPNMTGSPRPKIEAHGGQIPGPAAPHQHQHQHPHQHPHHQLPHQHQQQQQQQPQSQSQQQQQAPTNGAILNKNNSQAPPGVSTAAGVNPNAAPGPIPATTPLVVRQDNNGVQWIAFEYSRDRVKMEYTIRCDVETINVDTLTSEFKTENCVYPRACCNKDQYRGNRLTYETECNSVGWALAELNPCLRGKRGLIQRAVDSWRNSNSDPRLRSRRVRRMAKISTRKAGSTVTQPPNMGGPSGAAGMSSSGNMGHGSTGSMGKPSMATMGPTAQQLHHHHNHPDGNAPGGDDVAGEDDYIDAASGQLSEQQSHHRSHVYSDYSNSPYASNSSIGNSTSMISQLNHPNSVSSIVADSHVINKVTEELNEEDRINLFGDIPESKKRKFILVDDPGKGGRVRVRVTLDTVNIKEIPDSFRKSNSVYPRSWFPLQMQSPPPSANGSRFFKDDDEDDLVEVSGRAFRNGKGKVRINVSLSNGVEGEICVPRMRKSMRRKEVRLNDLGYRMTWHQSRVFADKTVFLQKALDSYRNKVRTTMESIGKDVPSIAPHFETRVGKRRWGERNKRERRSPDDA